MFLQLPANLFKIQTPALGKVVLMDVQQEGSLWLVFRTKRNRTPFAVRVDEFYSFPKRGNQPRDIAEEQFQAAVMHAVADPAKAVKLMKKAAAGGHSGALVNLGSYHRDGHGVRADWRKAKQYFERPAEAGDPHGMTSLARLILERGRTPAEHQKALKLLRAALCRGDSAANHFLGRGSRRLA